MINQMQYCIDIEKKYADNENHNFLADQIIKLNKPLTAKYVRIIIINEYVCLKFELLGCLYDEGRKIDYLRELKIA